MVVVAVVSGRANRGGTRIGTAYYSCRMLGMYPSIRALFPSEDVSTLKFFEEYCTPGIPVRAYWRTVDVSKFVVLDPRVHFVHEPPAPGRCK